MTDKLSEILEPLAAPNIVIRRDDVNAGTRLIGKMGNFHAYVAGAEFAPTAVPEEYYKFLADQIDAQLAAYDNVLAIEVAAFNATVAKAGAGGVIVV